MSRTRCKQSGCGSRAGFTIIEVLLAVVVFTIGILAVVWVVADGLRNSRQLHQTTVATFLAQQKLEQLRNTYYFDLASGVEQDEEGNEVLLDEYGQPGGIFARRWTVEENSPMAGTKTITVFVAWQESGGQEVSVSTVVARPFPEGMM